MLIWAAILPGKDNSWSEKLYTVDRANAAKIAKYPPVITQAPSTWPVSLDLLEGVRQGAGMCLSVAPTFRTVLAHMPMYVSAVLIAP
jgi:hypothetical protein